MAGFRLWEGIGIDDLLDHLYHAVIDQLRAEQAGEPAETLKLKVRKALKRVLNTDMYASPVCGIASICRPSEEGRVKPWSRRSYEWGLVAQPDPELDAPEWSSTKS